MNILGCAVLGSLYYVIFVDSNVSQFVLLHLLDDADQSKYKKKFTTGIHVSDFWLIGLCEANDPI